VSNKEYNCVILDRDGTLIEDRHYLRRPEQVKLLPHTGEALRILAGLGLKLVVVSNQSGIGRGYFTHYDLGEVHAAMNMALAAEGIKLDGIYICPHHPEDHCSCRKPQVELVDRAVHELDIKEGGFVVLGDTKSDIDLGINLNAATFLVRTGYGADTEAAGEHGADYVVEDLREAAIIVRDL
jgi:D-glycero-D-manno-heptose 1,7-bisphosphate phosphatase